MKIRLRTLLIAAVIAILSLLAAANAFSFALGFPDEFEYWALAENLVRTGTFSFDGVHPSASRPPLVAWVLTPFVAAGLPMAAARPWFVLFFAASGILAGWLLCRLFPDSTAGPVVGTAFVLAHPIYLFSAGNLYPQQILVPLLLATFALAILTPATIAGTIARSVGIGLLTAASMLATAPAIFALLPVFLLLAWQDLRALRRRQYQRAVQALIAVAALTLCLAPWFARNSRNVHPGIYLTLNSGTNLLLGNAPATTPTSGVHVDLSAWAPVRADESEVEMNRRHTQAAVDNIRGNPGYYARLYLRKFAAGFSNTVETVTHGYNKRATLVFSSYMALVWIGTGILLFRIFRRSGAIDARLPVLALLVLTGFVCTVAGYAIFFFRLRFRLPADVSLALVAAAGWELARASLAQRKTRTQRAAD